MALHSLKQAQIPDSPLAEDYEVVLTAIEPMTQVCAALAEDLVPLQEDTNFIKKRASVQDKVYAYVANNFSLGGEEFGEVAVLIRPRRWEMPTELRNRPNRPQVEKLVQDAQARMRIAIRPKKFPHGLITIRVDREDLEHNFEITYDIDIGESQGDGIVSRLTFPRETGQREGHHFTSFIRAEDFGITFAEILEAMNRKITQSVA